MLIFWVVGIVLCTVLVGLLKYYGIYEHVSWFKVMSIPVYGFVILPGICAIIVILSQQVERWLVARQKNKTRSKTAKRDERLRRVLVRPIGLWVLFLSIFCIFFSMLMALLICRQVSPEVDLSDDLLVPAFFVPILLIIFSLFTFVFLAVYTRLFIAKKGKVKAMKYLCEWKKPPGILKTV